MLRHFRKWDVFEARTVLPLSDRNKSPFLFMAQLVKFEAGVLDGVTWLQHWKGWRGRNMRIIRQDKLHFKGESLCSGSISTTFVLDCRFGSVRNL